MGRWFDVGFESGRGPDDLGGEARREPGASPIPEFVDKVLVKDHEEMALDNGEYPEGCHGAVPVANLPTVNKKVSFHCNGAQNEADVSELRELEFHRG